MENKNFIKLKKIVFITAIAVVLLIISAIISNIANAGKILIKIKYAPFNSKVLLDGKFFQNNSEQLISPGKYLLTVSLENFDTIEEEITITEDTEYIYGFLYPNNANGEKIRDSHIKDYSEIEVITSELLMQAGEKEREEKPILNYLPYNEIVFTLGYTYNEDNVFTITIRTPEEKYLNSAIEKLKEFDSLKNLSQYNITIIDYEDKLSDFHQNNEQNPKNHLEKGFTSLTSIKGEYYDDSYYYASITTGSEETKDLIIYKVILKKDSNSWKIIGNPYPILTTYNTSQDIPLDLLEKANNL